MPDDDFELRPMEPPLARARQDSLPLTGPTPEFGQPLDAPARRRPPTPGPTAAPVDEDRVGDYRHPEAHRTNIPEAGVATQDRSVSEKVRYEYDPHLDPQLVWAGKAEHTSFDVDTVSLHIHERVSTAAVLRAVRREEVQRTLFSDPQFSIDQELAFYQHDIDWANRLILGDSLLVMNSLLRREGMAGKVQCIYIDPPYGVNYNSNFQPRTDQRDVGSDDKSLTREPEQIRAYRDTWQLGIHSYLTYLRDRILMARELLADTGSVFVQINAENGPHVRQLLDEIFNRVNFVGQIPFVKTTGLVQSFLASRIDYLLWYAKDKSAAKYRQLYKDKSLEAGTAANYGWIELADGTRRGMSATERSDPASLPAGARVYKPDNITSQGNALNEFSYRGRAYRQRWKTNAAGMTRLAEANRLHVAENSLQYVRYIDDFPAVPITELGMTRLPATSQTRRFM